MDLLAAIMIATMIFLAVFVHRIAREWDTLTDEEVRERDRIRDKYLND
jgi:hypothetical protein